MLEQLSVTAENLIFSPHLLPIPRGIFSTIYVRLRQPMTVAGGIESCLREFYSGACWVRIFAAGKLPQIQYSIRTNFCDVGFSLAPMASD